jgi:hypothetical protein
LDEKKQKGINEFLRNFKKIATSGRGIDIVDRRKNLESLSKLEITKRNCREEILSLSVGDYCEGPKPDKDKPGEIWEFGRKIRNKEVYIKLKIAQVGEEMIAKCISFHVADHPLCFPFRGNSEEGGEKK